MLWLAVHLPEFPLEVLERGAAAAGVVALVTGRGGRRRLDACNAQALARGLRPGQSVAAALALVPELRLGPRDPRTEAAALDNLAAWAGQFSSLVSRESGAGLLLEIGGSLRLFGGVERLLEAVREGLTGLGYTGVLAAAPTPLGAWWLARGGGVAAPITEPGALGQVLDEIPLTRLELPDLQQEALAGIGLRRLGELSDLPRAELNRRFGPELSQQLDRAYGRLPDPRVPFRPPRAFTGHLRLPVEVTEVAALLFPLHRLLLELAGYLHSVEGGVQRFQVGLHHPRRRLSRLPVGLVAPGRDPGHWLSLLRARLERTPLSAPVEALSLRAPTVLPLAPRRPDLFEAARQHSDEHWLHMRERLEARLGATAVRGLALVADHRPERAWVWSRAPRPAGREGPANRPLWLLEVPRALRTVAGQPWCDGALRLAAGPERIEGGWWDGADVTRDYFVATGPAGQRYWIFRERRAPGGWYLHGLFA